MPPLSPSRAQKVVVASTVMLSFISFWRAAAIVLSDLASSAYYAGGIAEGAIGKSAPWFILGIMLFSYAVRSIYLESCGMFVRGGVYRVVHEAMGGTLAKFSVSALMFDYVLTGPISGVSAGLYLAGLINELGEYFHHPGLHVVAPGFAAVFAAATVIYFWRKNIIGLHESSEKALRIMQVTTAMVVILIAWAVYTIFAHGFQPVPLPTPENIRAAPGALGWLAGVRWATIPAVLVFIGLGHSLLAMSGEETLAQVNREIAAPKMKNLERAGFIIFIYSLLFTSLVSFFAVMLIPDGVRGRFLDNLIGGLSMYLAGPMPLRLAFHAFVVLVGTMILAGAVNTAIIGSNGVLNRVAEDGVLADWFRKPHKKFGTTFRMLNLIVGMQLATIAISRGDVEMLGQAYAFGVVWSFAMKALAVLVLRFKDKRPREFKVPLNVRVGGTELPIGLALVTTMLFLLAVTNVLTKPVATISGGAFTIAFFVLFTLSEQANRRKGLAHAADQEHFRLEYGEVAAGSVNARPGNVLVSVRNPANLGPLEKALEKSDPRKVDVVVVSVHVAHSAASGEHDLAPDQVFGDYERALFTRVVSVAEHAGKHVELLAISGENAWAALVQTAAQLKSSRIVAGISSKYDPAEQGRIVGAAWEKLPPPRPALSLELVQPAGTSIYFNLGPHPPRLWPEDVELLHQLWLELSDSGWGSKIRHRDVVGAALRRLAKDLHSERRQEALGDVNEEVHGRPTAR